MARTQIPRDPGSRPAAEAPVKSAVKARAGRTGRQVLVVLVISLALAVIALLILWGVFAASH
jgi:hypothetical protein